MFIKSGEEFEHFVAAILERNGHYAEVTQASSDFGVDLILNGRIAVQVKFYGSAVGPAAVQEVVAGSRYYKCDEAWVVTNSTYTPAAVALASSNDVRLIDGNELGWLAENPDSTVDHGERYRAMKEVKAQFGLGIDDDYFGQKPNPQLEKTTYTAGGITITRDQIERMSHRDRNRWLNTLTYEQFNQFQDDGLDLWDIPDRSGVCSRCDGPVALADYSDASDISLCAPCRAEREAEYQRHLDAEEAEYQARYQRYLDNLDADERLEEERRIRLAVEDAHRVDVWPSHNGWGWESWCNTCSNTFGTWRGSEDEVKRAAKDHTEAQVQAELSSFRSRFRPN